MEKNDSHPFAKDGRKGHPDIHDSYYSSGDSSDVASTKKSQREGEYGDGDQREHCDEWSPRPAVFWSFMPIQPV
jgi:hypothetical protein